MKYVYATVAGLALVAFAVAPAAAGDQKSKKTSDTQQLPASGGTSVTTEPKTDQTQPQGSVTTDSPSASPSTPGTTDNSLNPSKPADAPADTSESKEKK